MLRTMSGIMVGAVMCKEPHTLIQTLITLILILMMMMTMTYLQANMS